MLEQFLLFCTPMSFTGLTAFDRSIHKANIWLRDLMEILGHDNRGEAYLALRTVLQGLRDLLTPQEVTDLGAQLPTLIRGFYYEGWRANMAPRKDRTTNAFFDRVRSAFPHTSNRDPEHAIRSAFVLLSRHISEGEIEEVKQLLPKGFWDLWPKESARQPTQKSWEPGHLSG